MKPIAWMHRVNAAALQKEWNNAGDLRIVLHPGTLLQESQNVVLKRCNQVLENVRRDCPGVSIPTAVPSRGLQTQVIGTLEQAGVIGVGVLRNIYQSAQGLLESAFERVFGPLVEEARREKDKFDKTLTWIGVGFIGLVAVLALSGRQS